MIMGNTGGSGPSRPGRSPSVHSTNQVTCPLRRTYRLSKTRMVVCSEKCCSSSLNAVFIRKTHDESSWVTKGAFDFPQPAKQQNKSQESDSGGQNGFHW